jgi:hypothetical protein
MNRMHGLVELSSVSRSIGLQNFGGKFLFQGFCRAVETIYSYDGGVPMVAGCHARSERAAEGDAEEGKLAMSTSLRALG